ncbi:MAG: hypothetical protein ACT6R2_00950 [Blastomonas fulva]|uniref:hypothetical protein n=1 Tax=Blastomonas fulva TaxID=1550728 RepID=UPI00403458BC
MTQMFWPWRGAALGPLDARHPYEWFPAGNRSPTLQHIGMLETTSAANCILAMGFQKATLAREVRRVIISLLLTKFRLHGLPVAARCAGQTHFPRHLFRGEIGTNS